VSAIEEQTGQPADQLGAAVEQAGEGLRAAAGLEQVVLLDRDPRQLASLSGQLVAAAGELLLLCQQLVALRLPLLLRACLVISHVSLLLSLEAFWISPSARLTTQ